MAETSPAVAASDEEAGFIGRILSQAERIDITGANAHR